MSPTMSINQSNNLPRLAREDANIHIEREIMQSTETKHKWGTNANGET